MAVHALLGTGRALRNVANRRFHILGCQRLIVALAQLRGVRGSSDAGAWRIASRGSGCSPPSAGIVRLGATFSGDIPEHWRRSGCRAEGGSGPSKPDGQAKPRVASSWQFVHSRSGAPGSRACDRWGSPASSNGMDEGRIPNNTTDLFCGGHAAKREPGGERSHDGPTALLQILRSGPCRRLREREDLPDPRRPLPPAAVSAIENAETPVEGDRHRTAHQ